MKVLLGPCVNGIHFSRTFVNRLFELTGTKYFVEQELEYFDDINEEYYEDVVIKDDKVFFMLDTWDPLYVELRCSDVCLQLVEEMGREAFSKEYYILHKIIELPPDIEDSSQISIFTNDAGYEWIAEKHRTWS